MELKTAASEDLQTILQLYDRILELTPEIDSYAQWKKGLHPTESGIQAYLEKGELYLLKTRDEIVGAMAVTMEQGEDYRRVHWSIDAEDHEVSTIHLLGVDPDWQGKGIAGRLIDHAIRLAESKGKKALRLDAIETNDPAHRLYQKKGFSPRGTLRLYAENTGWTNFYFYERSLIYGAKTLLTKRLTLKEESIEDAEIFHQHLGCDPEISKFTGWNPYATLDSAKEKIQQDLQDGQTKQSYSWTIRCDSTIIGTIGAYDCDVQTNSIEVGYSIFRHSWGKGYATEALCTVIRYLFEEEGFSKIRAWSHPENIGSQKVLERSGMQKEESKEMQIIYGIRRERPVGSSS